MEAAAELQVAVAALKDVGPGATEAVRGYALLAWGEEGAHVTLFLEHAAVNDGYAGWLLGDGDPVSLGIFTLTPEGTGMLNHDLPSLRPQDVKRVRVISEPMGTALEGSIVWLTHPSEVGFHLHTEPATLVSGHDLTAQAVTTLAPPEPGETPVIVIAPQELPTAASAPQESPTGACASSLPTGRVSLAPQHPQANHAAGTAILDSGWGGLTLMLRGLPSPSLLGRDEATGRPYNAYQVWLLNRRSHIRKSVGPATRAWGGNFRLQVESGLPLHDYDVVLVTAGESMAAPTVLFGMITGA